jgi:hypothetical protein
VTTSDKIVSDCTLKMNGGLAEETLQGLKWTENKGRPGDASPWVKVVLNLGVAVLAGDTPLARLVFPKEFTDRDEWEMERKAYSLRIGPVTAAEEAKIGALVKKAVS